MPDWTKDIPPEMIEDEKRRRENERRKEDRPYAPSPAPPGEFPKERPPEDEGEKRGVTIIDLNEEDIGRKFTL